MMLENEGCFLMWAMGVARKTVGEKETVRKAKSAYAV